jgi:[acyl-carrier-protein] S-malonyltransferase
VIAGSKAAVEKACEVLKAQGAKRALPLPVSAPFPFQPDEAGRREAARALAATCCRAADSGAQQHRCGRAAATPTRIRDALYRQAFGPVRWVECVQALKARGITTWSNAARARCWRA